MKIIREEKIGKESVYNISEVILDEVIDVYEVKITGIAIQNRGSIKYIIYNSKLEVISDTYYFLNKRPKKVAANTKRNYFYGLKYLYAFKEIINKELNDFSSDDFFQLSSFLNGVSAKGTDYEYDLLTKRSNKTINIFFSVYREYFKCLDYMDSPLFQYMNNSFNSNKPFTGKVLKNETTPLFISEDEFSEFMKYLSNEDDINVLRSKCILRLMYQGGLRIGEVLGLTFEDLKIRTSSDGTRNFIILIRNRLSNKKYQQAKRCLKITDVRNYLSNDYRTRDVGFQEAIMFDFDGINTYDLISEYIDIAHSEAEKKNPRKYKETIADSVDSFRIENKENHYIFLNSKYGILSDETWNSELRKIFEYIGLSIDKKVRKNNLNHRFRHGFCMKLMYGFGDINYSSIKVFTRHKSDTGLDAYNNPTTSDLIKIKEDISRENGVIELFEEVKKHDK